MWCTLGTKWDEFPGTLSLPQFTGVVPDGEITLPAQKEKPQPDFSYKLDIYS